MIRTKIKAHGISRIVIMVEWQCKNTRHALDNMSRILVGFGGDGCLVKSFIGNKNRSEILLLHSYPIHFINQWFGIILSFRKPIHIVIEIGRASSPGSNAM